jgi:predicted nucleotidyltransferase component of viral defense system
MITQAEIQRIANSKGVNTPQIEKDYLLSWILVGIAHDKLLSKILVFKGGTVLKKFYFRDYRYSEDLDFTMLDKGKTNEAIKEAFEAVFDYVKEEANIPLSISDFSEHQTGTINFHINYTGPLRGTRKDVKVDISKNELLKFEMENKEMFNSYSDLESCEPCILQCYSLPEVMTEKMRSLLQRQQARDYYDLWYVSEYGRIEMADYRKKFEEKARHKHIKPEDLEERVNQLEPVFKKQWETSMLHQINDLTPFETVSRDINRHLRKISKGK